MAERMLNEEITKQLVELLAGMQNPVEIVFFGSQTQHCEYCEETRQLLEEVTALSGKLTLEMHDLDTETELAGELKVEQAPTFVITSRQDGRRVDHGIRFKGIPAGHEFTSLVNDVLLVSSGNPNLSEETRDFLSSLQKPVHLEVFVTPT